MSSEPDELAEVRAELARTREAFVAESRHSTTLARMLKEKTTSLAAARTEVAKLRSLIEAERASRKAADERRAERMR